MVVDALAVLDNPVWAALAGPHAPLAERHGQAARYPVNVSPFLAVPTEHDPRAWDDVAALVGPGSVATITGAITAPAHWEVLARVPGVQLVDVGVDAAPDEEAVPLTVADVPDMLALVQRTKPGPFLTRTVALGSYLGIRRDGDLVAMAGERLHPPGWTEISAVCTDPELRGTGLATRLVRALVAGIRDRGETPLMHAAAANTDAIRLYESLGFQLRSRPDFTAVRVPAP